MFCSKNGKLQRRGKMNLIGRLQLSTERSKEEDNEGIIQLRIFRVQVLDYFTCTLFTYSTQFSQENLGYGRRVHEKQIINDFMIYR